MSKAKAFQDRDDDFEDPVFETQHNHPYAGETDVEEQSAHDAPTEWSPIKSEPQGSYVAALSGPPDPLEDVERTLQTVSYHSKLNTVVEDFIQDDDHKELFFDLLARQCNLIKSRCQAFEDGHITVYDKVLLRLSDNGNRFDAIAAQAYYCAEYLGIDPDGDSELARKILDQNVVFKAILARAVTPRDVYPTKYSAATSYGVRGMKVEPDTQPPSAKRKQAVHEFAFPQYDFETHGDEGSLSMQTSQTSDISASGQNLRKSGNTKLSTILYEASRDPTFSQSYEPLVGAGSEEGEVIKTEAHVASTIANDDDPIVRKTKHLLSMFQQARADFEASNPRDVENSLDTARFLRDTTENTLLYIRDVPGGAIRDLVPMELQSELKSYGKAAQARVQLLAGGRKRKFDANVFKVPRRMEDRERSPESHRDGGGGSDRYLGRDRDMDVEPTTDWSRETKWHGRRVDSYIPSQDARRTIHGHGDGYNEVYARGYGPGRDRHGGRHYSPNHDRGRDSRRGDRYGRDSPYPERERGRDYSRDSHREHVGRRGGEWDSYRA